MALFCVLMVFSIAATFARLIRDAGGTDASSTHVYFELGSIHSDTKNGKLNERVEISFAMTDKRPC